MTIIFRERLFKSCLAISKVTQQLGAGSGVKDDSLHPIKDS